MKNINKIIFVLFAILLLGNITAWGSQSLDLGANGNISSQTIEDGTEWIVVNPGESGRGFIIQDENKNSVLTVDRYGAVYIKGKLFINDKEYGDSLKGAFTPINGFVYSLLAVSLFLHVLNFMRKK